MTREECIRSLQREYAELRKQNELEQEQRRMEAELRDPELERLRIENISLVTSAAKRLCGDFTREERREAAEQAKKQILANTAEQRRRIRALGLPDDWLSVRTRCPLCRDTGLVGEAPARFCSCFQSRLHTLLYEDGSMAETEEQNFARFDLTIFPEEDGQREQVRRVRDLCVRYSEQLPRPTMPGILLFGEGGLGKTYLLNCIYAAAVDRDIAAVRITAYRMFETMRRRHLGEEGGERSFSDLIDIPLLLIDDLGTEPMMRNITVEYLFALINERMAAHRCTVICTNLDPVRLQERYGERVYSRLIDVTAWRLCRLTGQDLRTLKRRRPSPK